MNRLELGVIVAGLAAVIAVGMGLSHRIRDRRERRRRAEMKRHVNSGR